MYIFGSLFAGLRGRILVDAFWELFICCTCIYLGAILGVLSLVWCVACDNLG